HSKKKCDEL
nr:Chain C, NS3-4A protein [Hepacivirus hominis]4QRP_H Chain H, NS3-4A protein [Hepacivirus hominis]4QRQ_C Chain C, NS3-4A protein [Hepacivirus hominis]